MSDLDRWRAIAAKAKRQYEEMAGFPGSNYVTRLGGTFDEACDYIERLERDRGLLMAALCDCDRADSDEVQATADKPGTHDWSCPYRSALRFAPSDSGGAGQDRSLEG